MKYKILKEVSFYYENKRKNKKVYQKNNIDINNKEVETIIKDNERTKKLIRVYEKMIKDIELEASV